MSVRLRSHRARPRAARHVSALVRREGRPFGWLDAYILGCGRRPAVGGPGGCDPLQVLRMLVNTVDTAA